MMHLTIMSAYILGTSYFPEGTFIRDALRWPIFNISAHSRSKTSSKK